jgi:hypothetical protein
VGVNHSPPQKASKSATRWAPQRIWAVFDPLWRGATVVWRGPRSLIEGASDKDFINAGQSRFRTFGLSAGVETDQLGKWIKVDVVAHQFRYGQSKNPIDREGGDVSLNEHLKRALKSDSGDEPDEIVDLYVTLSAEVFSLLTISLEGNWREIDSVWSARLDAADQTNKGKRHVHIAKTKHRSSKSNQVSWNDDGSRRDKKTFDTKLGQSRKAQAIAREILGLGESISLESKDSKQVVERPLLSTARSFSSDGKGVEIEFYLEEPTDHLPAWLRW